MRSQLLLASVAVSVLGLPALAGPLNPPAGPMSTYKTLDQVRPGVPLEDTGATIVISGPGYYYLTENVSSVSGGILIQATGVTLDLNGYTVIGNFSGNNSHHGVQLSPIVDDRPITIQNGSIVRFSGDGISATSGLLNVVLKDVHVSDCNSRGVDIAGNLMAIRCSAIDSGSDGFFIGGESNLSHCVARGNPDEGFEAERGFFSFCSATGNGDSGFDLGLLVENAGGVFIENCYAEGNTDRGILVSNNSVITGCVAIANGSTGIQGLRDVVITNCASRLNTRWGFRTGFNATVSDCVAADNGDDGFSIGSGSGITRCAAYQNTENGIDTGLGSGISDCGARSNGAAGFVVGAGSSITNCGSTINGTDGFTLQSDTRIMHCTGDGNGASVTDGAGIRSVSDCIIDSCLVTDNDFGIVAATGTLTVRCAAAGNSTANYDFAAGAEYGAIFSATPGFSSSNSFANIEF